MKTWKCLFCVSVKGPDRDEQIAMMAGIAVNQWLHQKGDTIGNYANFIDREMDIKDVVENAIREVDKYEGM